MMKKDENLFLNTPRLILRFPYETDCEKILAFDERNKAHLSSWRSPINFSEIDYKIQLAKWKEEFELGRSIRFLLFLKEKPEGEIIGFCNFSQIFRASFQACYLGYHIDAAFEGKGLMQEALKEAIPYMFEEQNLHRIMANYMPSNKRSASLLSRLGFIIEGRAEKYLLINGQWEDHILTSLTNENWKHVIK